MRCAGILASLILGFALCSVGRPRTFDWVRARDENAQLDQPTSTLDASKGDLPPKENSTNFNRRFPSAQSRIGGRGLQETSAAQWEGTASSRAA
jgi:hypothetical protein